MSPHELPLGVSVSVSIVATRGYDNLLLMVELLC